MPNLRPEFDGLLKSYEAASTTKPYQFKLDDVDDAFLREAYRIVGPQQAKFARSFFFSFIFWPNV